jgi:hypothetical protein
MLYAIQRMRVLALEAGLQNRESKFDEICELLGLRDMQLNAHNVHTNVREMAL